MKPSGRSESRDVTELKRLQAENPDLAGAADLQIALIEVQQRVQSRVPLPWAEIDRESWQHEEGLSRPLLRFEHIPLNWSDFRFLFRETTEILRRYEALDAEDYRWLQALAREGHSLEPLVIAWYRGAPGMPPSKEEVHPVQAGVPAAHRHLGAAPAGLPSESPVPEMLQQVITLAMRPFLARCAEVILPNLDLSGWRHGTCPLCGGEPDFAVITPTAERRLICGRCTGRWPYDGVGCPFCGNDDRSKITSFASRDAMYRITACDVCKRYLKAYDARRGSRPIMLPVESVATLPLDAAAMQRGYVG